MNGVVESDTGPDPTIDGFGVGGSVSPGVMVVARALSTLCGHQEFGVSPFVTRRGETFGPDSWVALRR